MRALWLVALLAVPALSGCSDGGGKGPETITDPKQLESGKGAVAGLLIDDRYRPLPGGLVLLQPLGLTTTSDANGEFQFVNLEPGQYTARATIEGHEAAPQPLRVEAGRFAELNLEARRILSEGNRVVTSEYNVFVACNFNLLVVGYPIDCTFDQSGDTDRAAFLGNFTGLANATYMVTEMKADKVGNYEVRVRPQVHDDGPDDNYAVMEVKASDYMRIVNQLGVVNHEAELTGNNQAWNNTEAVHVIFYVDAPTKNVTGQGDFGVSADIGYRAKFVISVFLGEPDVDMASYHVLSSSA